MYYAKVVNLDIPIIRDAFPSLNDFRVYFTVICVILPLGLVFFGLFFLNSLGVLIWYLLLLSGICIVIAALLATFLEDALRLNVDPASVEAALYFGIALVVAMLVVACIAAAWERSRKEKQIEENGEDNEDTVAGAMIAETKDFPWIAQIQRLIMFVIFVVFGLVFLQFLFPFSIGDSFSGLQLGLGITGLILGFFTFIWLIMGCIRSGREKQWKFFHFMEKQFMRLLLITMSMVYIPIGAGLFVLFNCNDQSCPVGKFFIKEGSGLPHNNSLASRRDVCIPCNMNADQRCAARNLTCSGVSASRLEVDNYVDCDDLQIFYYAAYLIAAMYMLGVPIMFGQLVLRVTSLVTENFPVKVPAELAADDMEGLWALKVVSSDNSARFLYQPFIPELKYSRLFQLLQKLLVVFTAVFVIRVGVNPVYIALGASLVIHVFSFGWLVKNRPFLHKFENGIAILMEIALTAATCAALCLMLDVDVPDGVLIAIIVLNGVLPLVAIIIGIALEWTSKKSKEEQEKEEQRIALDAELQKRAQEDADHEMAEGMQSQENMPDSPVNGSDSILVGTIAGVTGTMNNSKMTVDEKRRLQRQRAEAARAAVLARRQEEALELLTKQQDVDHRIDVDVKKQLNMFLMVGGAMAFVALGLCIVGHLSRNNKEPIRWNRPDHDIDNELAGYGSWDNFTKACCCVSNWGDPARTRSRVVEQWNCDNGVVKERVRSTFVTDSVTGATVLMDGFAIRPECGLQFRVGCLLMYGGASETGTTSSKPKTVPFCGPTVNTTGYALQFLW